jgi:hypothetical protein
MTSDEMYLFLLAADREYDSLCRSIVHDGRDPFWVAEGMKQQLADYTKNLQALWEVKP